MNLRMISARMQDAFARLNAEEAARRHRTICIGIGQRISRVIYRGDFENAPTLGYNV
jgi:hypothetical protein